MKKLTTIIILLCICSKAMAHYSLKQHSIIHYYPILEKEILDKKCKMGSLKRKNCVYKNKDKNINPRVK